MKKYTKEEIRRASINAIGGSLMTMAFVALILVLTVKAML